MIGESSFQLLLEDHLHFNVVPVTIEAASAMKDSKYYLST